LTSLFRYGNIISTREDKRFPLQAVKIHRPKEASAWEAENPAGGTRIHPIKFFEKLLDKPNQVCYNNNVKRMRTASEREPLLES
jgi:hypothetical protein